MVRVLMTFAVVVMVIVSFVGAMAFRLVLMWPQLLLRGWVLSVMWGWFILPLGLVPITIPQAIGLMFIVRLLDKETTSPLSYPEEEAEEKVRKMGLKKSFQRILRWCWKDLMMAPASLLLSGWILHRFF